MGNSKDLKSTKNNFIPDWGVRVCLSLLNVTALLATSNDIFLSLDLCTVEEEVKFPLLSQNEREKTWTYDPHYSGGGLCSGLNGGES